MSDVAGRDGVTETQQVSRYEDIANTRDQCDSCAYAADKGLWSVRLHHKAHLGKPAFHHSPDKTI